jgi:hypothetical protein
MYELRPVHEFCNVNGNILKKNWQLWKYTYGVASTTTNILPQIFDKEFFTFCKEKKRWHIHTIHIAKFAQIKAFLKKFIRLKGSFKKSEERVFLWKFNGGEFKFGLQWQFSNAPNQKLGPLDLQDVLGHLDKEDIIPNPYFLPLLQQLAS